MKYTVAFEGEFYEDREILNLITNATELSICISDAQCMVRARLKWEEGISDKEDEFLRELLSTLHLDCLE